MRLTDANRLKFTPDGSKVIILDGGTGTLIVLDAKTRKEIKRLKVADRDTGDGWNKSVQSCGCFTLGLQEHRLVQYDEGVRYARTHRMAATQDVAHVALQCFELRTALRLNMECVKI